MMENDDTLIKNFMLANKHEIEDNGFSRGVIRRLPQPAQWLSDILSVTCAIICCALFCGSYHHRLTTCMQPEMMKTEIELGDMLGKRKILCTFAIYKMNIRT